MTDLQFALLRRIRSDESHTVVSMLNTMDADPVAVSSELSTLTDQGLVEKSAVSDSYCILSLTYKGVSALLSETEDRTRRQLAVQQQIEQEQHRKEEQHRIAEDQAALQAKEHASDRHIQELSYELDKHIRREAAPSEVFFASDGLPILCKSLAKKYGDYTAYLNRKSEIYHLDPSCAPAGSPVVHLFNVPRNYRACSRCALGISRSIPDWYK